MTARLTDPGIRDMVGRRGDQAGIQNVHPTAAAAERPAGRRACRGRVAW
jgi:hypothetical protein